MAGEHRVIDRNHDVYTPSLIAIWARQVMGCIDLDPASCEAANRVIRASRFYTAEDNGLHQPWAGRVFINPPFNGGLLRLFARTLMAELLEGDVTRAVFLAPVVGNKWVNQMFGLCDTFSVLHTRIPWEGPGSGISGSAMTHGLWTFNPAVKAIPDCPLIAATFTRQSSYLRGYL